MEQTVNTFGKGLQMDTNPMVQGNETLSNALNATFVTMNGNEVILQNDMGNRRVDNAYLPSGYEPIGIKEHGGVIYLALYNPITNKSQIGSFPSPERKISSEDGSGLGGTLNLEELLLDTYLDNNLSKIDCIKKDTILVPLTKDTSLHAGDKFVVYTTGNLENTSDITNYKNVSNNKIISPKNKKYTLSLGVLNSLNEFVDITKTLSRWNRSTLINYTDKNVSDTYKFNDGYFIAEGYTPSLGITLENRQLIAANTYSYKLIGPLYIKALLNHILEFNYNIYGIINSNGKVELWIEGYVTYNCPDGGVSEGTETGDDRYISYEEGELKRFVVFDLIIDGDIKPESIEEDSVFENTTYDVNSNMYNYKIVKHYTNINNPSDNKLNYVIGVRADNDSEIYLSGLSDKGVIDTSLLGSDTVELSGWRFINNYSNRNSTSTITYTFNAYPKFGETFYDFLFNFIDVENPSKTISIPSTIYNGKNSLNINWERWGILPNKLYKVIWKYKKSSNPNTFITEENDDRWLLTTELFNSCYSPGSSEYILDYGNIPQEGSERDIFDSKCSINYSIDSEVIDKSLESQTESTGLLISKESDILLKYTTTKEINLSLNSVINYDSSLYPDYISVKENPGINFVENSIKGEFDGKMEWVNNYSGSFTPSEFNPTFVKNNNVGNSEIKGTLTNYDVYKSLGINTGNIVNGFISIENFFGEILETLGGTGGLTYNTIITDWEDTNKDDDHYLGARIGSTTDHPNPEDNFLEIEHRENDGKETFNLKQYIGAVYDKFQAINKKQVFTWSFINNRDEFYISNKPLIKTGKSMYNYARVWWRTSFGNWALFPKIFYNLVSGGIKAFLILLFDSVKNYKFAYYKNTTYSEAGLYRPSNNSVYNMEYSFNCDIKWKLKTAGNPFEIEPLNVSFKKSYPIFTGKKFESKEFSKSYEITTSKAFLSSIENISKLSQGVDGIDLESGKMLDSNNEILNPNIFYLEVNEKLEPRNSLPGIELTDAYGEDGKRTLLYSKESKGNPEDLYDVSGNDGDNDSVVVYEDVILVRL